MGIGELFSILTAAVWALGVVLFRKSGETLNPHALNLFKNCVALGLFLPSLFIYGHSLFIDRPAVEYFVLILSGMLGIGIADTLFFQSLNRIGAGTMAIVEATYSPMVILLSMLLLSERLSTVALLGGAAILFAVLLTIEREGRRKSKASFVALGIGAVALMAIGIVPIKPTLSETPVIWAIIWRLLGGIGVLLILGLSRPGIFDGFRRDRGLSVRLLAAFTGAYLAMMFWIAGMKYTDASRSAILNQLQTPIMLLLAGWILKESIPTRKIVAVLIAFVGAVLVIMG